MSQRKPMRSYWLSAVLLLLAVTAPLAHAELTFRVGASGDSLGFGIWYLADDGGFFAKNGLRPKFVFLSADAIPAALVSGGIEATPMTETVMGAQLAGYAVRDVALLVARPVFEVLTRGDVKTIADLKGKTIIASPPRSLPTRLMLYLLGRAKLDPANDVKVLAIASVAARQTLMLSGKGDAIIESTVTALQLRHKLLATRVIAREADMPQQLADGVGVSVDLIDKSPELIRAMLRALAEADAKARSQPGGAGGLLAKRFNLPDDAAELGGALIASLPNALTPTPGLYAAEAAFMSAATDKPVTAERVAAAWDTRFSAELDHDSMAKQR